jgi:hypothetical protein
MTKMIATLRFLSGKPALTGSSSSSSSGKGLVRSKSLRSIRSSIRSSCSSLRSSRSSSNNLADPTIKDHNNIDYDDYFDNGNAKWYDDDKQENDDDDDDDDDQSDTTSRCSESAEFLSQTAAVSSPLNVLQRRRLSMDRTKVLYGHLEQHVEIQQIFQGQRINGVAIRHSPTRPRHHHHQDG